LTIKIANGLKIPPQQLLGVRAVAPRFVAGFAASANIAVTFLLLLTVRMDYHNCSLDLEGTVLD